MKKQGHRFTSVKDSEQRLTRFLVVTPTMNDNYRRFGELVSLDVLPAELLQLKENPKRLHCIVLSINDTNMRVLPVGVALLEDLSHTSYCQLLTDFEGLTEQPLQHISTDRSAELALALEKLRLKKIMHGSQIFTPFYLLQSIDRQLKEVCEPIVQYRINAEFNLAIHTRSQRVFQRTVELLR